MKERIKNLRKTLSITQEDFSKRLGLARNSIASYETGRREPTNAVIKSICREYNVNEKWLRSGEGEMFNNILEEDELAAYCADIVKGKEPEIADIFIKYMRLNEQDKEVIRRLLSSAYKEKR